jgi:elongation factor G
MMGVETQSETVWQQANKFSIPRLGFINKMDRLGAEVKTTTDSVKRRLKVEPILLNIPARENSLDGLIDLTQNVLIDYS